MHTKFESHFNGIPVFTSDLMVKTVVTEVKIKRSFYKRWIEPIKHPVTIPFEPWVKEKTEIVTTIVPSDDVLQWENGLLMHPETFKTLKEELTKSGILKSSI